MLTSRLRAPWLPVCLALIPLLLLYLATLQAVPNGSSHYFMIDAGETQIVLNEWGSLHPTGYPLYTISGNVLTAILRSVGISPIIAPALVSLLWGMLALLLLYVFGAHLGASPWLAASMSLLYGLTRTVWIHNVIAEIYSFDLLLLLTLLCLAFWRGAWSGRVYWLAFTGGIALAHHRAFITILPAMLYAIWPTLRASGRKFPRLLIISLVLVTVGFTQYAWPLLRAQSGAAWIYGAPSTLPALLDVILAEEYSRFIGLPSSLTGLQQNIELVNNVLLQEMSLPGILAGLAGLALALRTRRRLALTLLLSGMSAWLFHILFYRDILSALILPITLSLTFGWLFAAEALLMRFGNRQTQGGVALCIMVAALLLTRHNLTFIRKLTNDPAGLETVALLEAAPPDSTVMLAWGTRYFAAAAAQLYLGRLAHITLADHNQDLRPAFENDALITPEYTFFNQPPAWWADKLGQAIWLQAAGPRLIHIRSAPEIVESDVAGPAALDTRLHCQHDRLALELVWHAGVDAPVEDLSVYVKAFAADGSLIAQADQFAPVYGLRPTSSWLAGERLRDFFPLDVNPAQVSTLAYGLYRVNATGEFENVLDYFMNSICPLP